MRKRNLLALVGRYGRQQALADAVGLSVQYINQMLSGHRSIGEKTARKIEAALQLPVGWMDRDEDTARGFGNVEPGPEIVRQVPLISWVQAGHWHEACEVLSLDEVTEWIPVPAKLSSRAFALRVRGDSMEPRFPEGAVVVVEPDIHPKHRDYVIVRFEDGTNECMFKQYIEDLPNRFLKPLNTRYPLIQIDGKATVVGIVKWVVMSV